MYQLAEKCCILHNNHLNPHRVVWLYLIAQFSRVVERKVNLACTLYIMQFRLIARYPTVDLFHMELFLVQFQAQQLEEVAQRQAILLTVDSMQYEVDLNQDFSFSLSVSLIAFFSSTSISISGCTPN